MCVCACACVRACGHNGGVDTMIGRDEISFFLEIIFCVKRTGYLKEEEIG